MRPINFRAFDEGEMFEVKAIDFNDLEVAYTHEGIIKKGRKGIDWNDLYEVKLMEFTGLTDKYDNSIY